jgi:hypothetical protein
MSRKICAALKERAEKAFLSFARSHASKAKNSSARIKQTHHTVSRSKKESRISTCRGLSGGPDIDTLYKIASGIPP